MPSETLNISQITPANVIPKGAKSDTIAIPEIPKTADAQTRAFMESVKEILETREGQRRNTEGSRVVTFNDLATAGLYDTTSKQVVPVTRAVAGTDTIPPAPPTAFQVTAGGSFNLLTWNNPPDEDLSHIEVYVHEVSQDGVPFRGSAGRLALVTAPLELYYHSNLSPTRRYGYWIRAVDTCDNVSEWTPNDGRPPIVVDPDPRPWQQEIYDLVFGDLSKNPLVLALNRKINAVGAFWQEDVAYQQYDVVLYGDKIWQAKRDNMGKIPVTGDDWAGPFNDMSQITAYTGRRVTETETEFSSRISVINETLGSLNSTISQLAGEISLRVSQTIFKNLIAGVIPLYDAATQYRAAVEGDPQATPPVPAVPASMVLYAPTEAEEARVYMCMEDCLGVAPTPGVTSEQWKHYGQIGQQVETNTAAIQVLPNQILSQVENVTFDLTDGGTTTLASLVTQLANQYTVQLNAISGERSAFAGFGLTLNPETLLSEFIIQSDKFLVIRPPGLSDPPGQTPVGVFGIDATTGNVCINADLYVLGGIRGEHIAADTITADNIDAETITGNEISARTITAGHIAFNTITGNEIAANSITATHISAGAISANDITTGSLDAQLIKLGGTPLPQLFSGVVWAMDVAEYDSTATVPRPELRNFIKMEKNGYHLVHFSGKVRKNSVALPFSPEGGFALVATNSVTGQTFKSIGHKTVSNVYEPFALQMLVPYRGVPNPVKVTIMPTQVVSGWAYIDTVLITEAILMGTTYKKL